MIAGFSFTGPGSRLLSRIKSGFDGELEIYDIQNIDLKNWLKNHFSSYQGLIFVGATGIAVRLIAPLLAGKDRDPAVIVIDEMGRFVIPLLSGHLGGANQLAGQIANEIGGTLVLTTATDINNKFSVDTWARAIGCQVANPENIKHVSSAILRGEPVGFKTDFPIEGSWPEGLNDSPQNRVGIQVALNESQPFEKTLNLVPQIIQVGLGCRRGADYEKLDQFLHRVLNDHGLPDQSVAGFSSIDLKQDETCFKILAEKFKRQFIFFTKEELAQVPGSFTSSKFVEQTVGLDNVCERCAKLASGGDLILKKTTADGFSLALAKRPWQVNFNTRYR